MSKKVIAPESKLNGMNVEDVAKDKNADVMTPAHRNALRRAEMRSKFVSPPECYAESNVFFRNYLFKDAHKIYPDAMQADYRFVDKCYPYAKGGMLLVDEPRTEMQLKRAKDRHVHLIKMGFRHIIFEENMSLIDFEMQEEADGLAHGKKGLKD